jgi:putative phosphoribosyl transferase
LSLSSRGGVPVAFEVAAALHAPLDLFLVRKLGVPGYEELALGAIATGGARVLFEPVVQGLAAAEGCARCRFVVTTASG